MIPTIQRISSFVEIPNKNAKRLLGIDPVIIEMKDMTSKMAYYRLWRGDPYLKKEDFRDPETFWKYFYIKLGLLEYPVALIGGEPGGGKSLIMAKITYDFVRLFGKKATMDWAPPDPTLYGDVHNLYDTDYTDKIQGELKRLATMQAQIVNTKDAAQRAIMTMELDRDLEKMILYKAVFGLDEGDSWGEKSGRINLTKLVSRIKNRRRHFFTCMFLVLIDPTRFDQLIYNGHTHDISCFKDRPRPGFCSYIITDIRRSGNMVSRGMILEPAKETRLWNSYGVVSLSHDVEVHLGGNVKPKKKEDKQDDE
jgi:hypothetical protein